MNEQMIRKNNMRIFPLYKMFAWDLLFYYAIIFLFLTQVKGFTASQVLLVDSLYAIFKIVFQIPCVNLTDLIGKQKSLLVGNLFVTLSIIIIILGNGFSLLILFNLLSALGYSLKGICEPTILSDSIPVSSSSFKIYSKIDSKGSGLYFIFDAISSFTTGFLYVLNPYIPMIMCLICCLISTVLSLAFNNPVFNTKIEKNKSTGFIDYYKDILTTFKQIMKSDRLKSLLFFSLCFGSILAVWSTLRSSILVDIGVPEQYFGIILAVMQIISSISSRKQQWFHNKLKNRVLTWFSLSISIGLILTGLLVVCNINFATSLTITLITIALFGIIKAPYYTFLNRYFNSFSNPEVNTKIFAVESLIENIGKVILALFASYLLDITTTAYTVIVIGSMFFIIFIFLLNYMKTKVGLKPEEYSKEDLIFSNEDIKQEIK